MDSIARRQTELDYQLSQNDICAMPKAARSNQLTCNLKESKGLTDWMVCKDEIGRVTITQHKKDICPKYWSNMPQLAAPTMPQLTMQARFSPV